jgi:poly-gamma-glutamate system protein
MERVLREKEILRVRSIAASLGGGADRGRGLSPDGRRLLEEAIRRNGVPLLDAPTLEQSVTRRMALYDSAAAGTRFACYVNIGGGVASLGGSQNALLIPPGLSRKLPVRNYPVRAVINRFADAGVPVLNISGVEAIAAMYGLPVVPGDTAPEPGEGPLFFRDRYSITGTVILTGLLALVLFLVIRVDIQSYLRRRNDDD